MELEERESKEIAEYKGRGLRERESYPVSTEVQGEYYDTRLEEAGLRDYLYVLLKRKWVVVSCLIASVVTVLIASFMMDKVYRAEAVIEITPEEPKITTFQEVMESETQQRDFYETQYKLIKSQSLAREVVTDLGLGSHPEFASTGEKTGFTSHIKTALAGLFPRYDGKGWDPQDEKERESAIEKEIIKSFLSRVDVTPDRTSRLVNISFESTDPELAVKAVNTLVDKYIEWILQRKVEATKSAREFLEKQLQEAKARLERSEEELNRFAKSADIISLDENLNLVYKQLAELNEALSKAESERLSKEALYREVKSGNYTFMPQVINDPSIQALYEEYTRLKADYDNKSVVYGTNLPEMKQLEAQLQRIEGELKRRGSGIAESLKKDYETALSKENIFRRRTEEQKRRATELNEKAVQYKILAREVETNKSIYKNLLQRLKETEVTSAIKATNIQVVDYATGPLPPYKPNIKLNALLATLMGIIGGIFLAFVFEYFDSTIKDEEEIERRFSLAFLGAVPLAVEGDRQGIERAVYTNPRSVIAEAYRVIKTSILYSSPDHPPRSILVASAQALEGKTTTASNIALSLIQSGLKVVLIDGDLRKPRLHKVFLDNGNESGLTTYLIGKAEPSALIKRGDIPELAIIPSGPFPPNPAELLGSRRMKELIERLLEEYDHVIIDGAPIMGFADSRLLSRLVDGVLLVTSIGVTHRQALRNSIEGILRVKGRIIGAIVNRLETGRGKYGHYYYYSSYYGDAEREGKKLHIYPPRS